VFRSRTYFVDKESKCPHCGYKLDAASSTNRENDRAPEAGDRGVCIMCAGIIVYVDRWTMRAPTPEEEKESLENPELQSALAAVRKLHGD